MAVQNASGALRRLTGVGAAFASTGPYTIMGWVKVNTPIVNSRVAMEIASTTSSVSDLGMWHNSGVTFTNVNGTSVNQGGSLILDTWQHFAIVRAGATDLKLYLNGSLRGTQTTDVTGRATHTEICCGGQINFNGNYINDGLAAFKTWTRALSGAEVLAEYPYRRAQSVTNLWTEWTMRDSAGVLTDASANNFSLLSTGGTWNTIGDPPGLVDNPIVGKKRKAYIVTDFDPEILGFEDEVTDWYAGFPRIITALPPATSGAARKNFYWRNSRRMR